MRAIADAIRDIWCVFTHRCRPRVQDDQFLAYLKEEETAANESAERIRKRRRGIQEGWRQENHHE